MTMNPRNESIVSISNLTKTFAIKQRSKGAFSLVRDLVRPQRQQVSAVKGISFEIPRGERVAFVGPNGAGKSTTLKMLSGILHPTSGDVRVCGLESWSKRRRLAFRIGTVFGQRSQLWQHLPAKDSFELLGRMYELDRTRFHQRRNKLVDAFGVASFQNQPVKSLSLGQRMRCELVASLLHEPEVLFLDEPTIGLDINAKQVIRDLVRQESEDAGTTLILTSHDTGDMERVCERVIVINDGQLILDQPVNQLRSGFLKRKLVTFLTDAEALTFTLPGVEMKEQSPYRTVLEVNTDETPIEALIHACLAQSRLRDLSVEDPPMEEVVQLIYAGANGRRKENGREAERE